MIEEQSDCGRFMIEPRNRNGFKQPGGALYFVPEAYVWSEILYLDSKTDYREYISLPQMKSLKDDMTMQDDESCWPSLIQVYSIAKRAFSWCLSIFEPRTGM